MNEEFNFEVEPFEFQSESAQQEWEAELGRRQQIPGQLARYRQTPLRSRRLTVRPPRPPIRPNWPPRRPGWPSVAIYEPPSAAPVPEPEGSEYVRWVQNTLNQVMSLRLPVDGIMGPDTRSAIRSFQQRQGLPVDGIVGPETERALGAANEGQSPDAPAEFEAFDTELADQEWQSKVNRNSRDYIKWVQRSLNQIMGLRLAVDGISGPQTRSAIRSFQMRQGLEADGIVGSRTEAALSDALAKQRVPVARTPTTMDKQDNIIFGLDTASVADNKNPNWVQAKAEGSISFAIIRSNWGDWEDSVFKRDWPKIKKASIVRGAYLFLRFPHPKYGMKAPDPVSQAKALIKTVGRLDESDFPPTIDVEFPGARPVTGMTARQCLDGVRAAWQVLKDYYGVAPIIYTSGRVWHEDLDDLPAPDLVESPLWLARYPFKEGPAVRDARVLRLNPPPVPPPWGDATNWWIHQYQGDAVRLPGFPTGNVDMNRFNTMRKGAAGDRVKWVQRRLGIAQNGQFDAAMDGVLRAFQNKKGLVSNGVVDPRTFAYLCWSNP